MIGLSSQTEIVRMMKQRKNEALQKIAEKHGWKWYNSKFPTMENGGCFQGNSPEEEKARQAGEKAEEAAKKAYVNSLAKAGYVDTSLGNFDFLRINPSSYAIDGKTIKKMMDESYKERKAALAADVSKVEAAFRQAEEDLMLMGSKEFADAFKAFVAQLEKLMK
jgi:hypothetical protein